MSPTSHRPMAEVATVATGTLTRLARAWATAYPAGPPLGEHDLAEAEKLLHEPVRLRVWLERRMEGELARVRVTGTLDRRLLFLERPGRGWVVADLSGRAHRTRLWPAWTTTRLRLRTDESWLSEADLAEDAVYRLTRPDVLLAALYHPENFPLPRFPLGISAVARAARGTLLGSVELADMQLGLTVEDLIDRIRAGQPDILGVGATFGQHDLMIQVLDAAFALPEPPMVVAGGSLTARNEGLLLARYPDLLVARAGGEATIEGVLAHWHGDIPRQEVPGIGFTGAARGGGLVVQQRRTAKPVARDGADDILPELDLLDSTFIHQGVVQLETSRGCTNFCSFCPRGHKGQWAGAGPDRLPWLLDEVGRVLDRHPEVSRTLYLVDEEIIGGDEDAAERVVDLASKFHQADFAWESSCRIDQVARLDRDEEWHVDRAVMWRRLLDLGLRRMLFGVESGVDTILARFNKETTGAQNALAIRTLTALGVPTRLTYITFDPLMTLAELKATHAFQGRTDLILRPQYSRPSVDVVRGVRDEGWVKRHSTGRPLYSEISYSLVSMECLTGAAYTRKATAAGLTGEVEPLMGRVACRYQDWRIGVASAWAQRWVDRHFALDYTFKSLEKVLDDAPRHAVRQARIVLKTAAHHVLGDMIALIDTFALDEVGHQADLALAKAIEAALDDRLAALRERVDTVVAAVGHHLTVEHGDRLRREYTRWRETREWRLINETGACAT